MLLDEDRIPMHIKFKWNLYSIRLNSIDLNFHPYGICFVGVRYRTRCPSISSSIAFELNVPRGDFSSIAIEITFVT